MTAVRFQYDVAFSFLDQDEPLARQLAALLAPMQVFVYSEQQLAITATDGIETFTRVFRREARIVVILYRDGWGKTKWTRIEEEAIKGRNFDDGADFLILVQLDKTDAPGWFPVTRIWVDLERFGSTGAASVIQERVKQGGGAVRAETPQENAARLEIEKRVEALRLSFLNSEEGVHAAKTAVTVLFDRLAAISAETGIAFDREPQYALLYRDGYSVAVSWSYSYRNSLDQSVLYVVEWRGRPDIGASRFHSPDKKEIRTQQFTFDISGERDPMWREAASGRRFSGDGFADHCVNLLLERIRAHPRQS